MRLEEVKKQCCSFLCSICKSSILIFLLLSITVLSLHYLVPMLYSGKPNEKNTLNKKAIVVQKQCKNWCHKCLMVGIRFTLLQTHSHVIFLILILTGRVRKAQAIASITRSHSGVEKDNKCHNQGGISPAKRKVLAP